MAFSDGFKQWLGGGIGGGLFVALIFLGMACEPSEIKPGAESASKSTAAEKAAPTTAPTGAAAAFKSAKATIEGRSNSKLTGEATFSEVEGGVKVMVHVMNAPPGKHAVHIHEKGDCSAPDATSAGGHFNPGGKHQHGAPDAADHHPGDFGNMEVGANGHGMLELTAKELTVKDGPNSVVGRGIIIHEKEDDMKTQPTGNAGGRIGCGVIQAQ